MGPCKPSRESPSSRPPRARSRVKRDSKRSLTRSLGALTEPLGIASSAVFVAGEDAVPLRLVAWTGFADPDGLAEAVRRPGHPIAAAFEDGVAAFDIRPVAPGGPSLRGHLPLLIRRDGSDAPVGLLALAYEEPLDGQTRQVLEAVADLLAVAVDRDRATH